MIMIRYMLGGAPGYAKRPQGSGTLLDERSYKIYLDTWGKHFAERKAEVSIQTSDSALYTTGTGTRIRKRNAN